MKRLLSYIYIMCALPLVLGGCIREDEYDNSPTGNFEALWKLIDEHYCFLDYKGIDWDAIYEQYRVQITDDMGDDALFEVLGNMLAELKDGHVNLYSAWNTNLDEMLLYLAVCNGLIIDVRNNGGGNLTTASQLAARFTNERVLTGYIQHKTGPGHSDFSDPEPVYLDPSDGSC